MVWQVRSGRSNEAIDCEVYALHASRAVKIHVMDIDKWAYLENKLKHSDIYSDVISKKQYGRNDPSLTHRGRQRLIQ